MCILFIAVDQHPEYPLVIAANRDEYYRRPSREMHWWRDRPGVLAGRDLLAGGTWLGMHRGGAFAAVTNFRRPMACPEGMRSRGELVARFLDGQGNVASFASFLNREHNQYNPFNLVFGHPSGLLTWGHDDPVARPLSSGFHSVSNGPMDHLWPKMSRGVSELSRLIGSDDVLTADALLPIMLDQTQVPDGELPDTGFDLARERALSPIFVRGTDYGTRTTTILLFGQGAVDITEYRHDGRTSGLSKSRFQITSAPG